MKTPGFWYKKKSAAALALLPFSALYLCGRALHRLAIQPYKSTVPVICVGNLTAGGSGKTPTALALMKLVQDHSLASNPCFLTRGYGGTLTGPAYADPVIHTYRQTGDEALLLARAAPTIVSRDRAAGAKFAESHNHDLIIMDDGLQNGSLEKTLSFAVIDGAHGFGNGLPLPAGPLRETLKAGIARTNAFIIIGEDSYKLASQIKKQALGAALKPGVLQGGAYFAFCGIGLPEKFRKTLADAGADLRGLEAFPDHHPYTGGDLARLDHLSREKNARLITTEKDMLRLPRGIEILRHPEVLPVHLVFSHETEILALLKEALK